MGKGIPLPTDLPWEVQLLFWILMLFVTVLVGLCVWFLVRHINQQDNSNISTKKSIADLSIKMDATDKVVSDGIKNMNDGASALRTASLDYQKAVHNEILSIKKDMIHIEKSVDRTKAKAGELETKVDSLSQSVSKVSHNLESVSNTVATQQGTLQLGAKAIARQKERIDKVATEVQVIGKNLVLIKGGNGGTKT